MTDPTPDDCGLEPLTLETWEDCLLLEDGRICDRHRQQAPRWAAEGEADWKAEALVRY